MPKGKLLEDTFEQLVELGHSTAKKTVKSVAQTLNPLSGSSNAEKNTSANSLKEQAEKLKNKKDSHTPLDFDKLQKKFQDKDKIKTEALRNRLFQMVKQGDEKIITEHRQKELEKKRQQAYLEQEKKRKEEEKKKQQGSAIPMGKIRKTIFSPKKTAERQHAETKPATGKQ